MPKNQVFMYLMLPSIQKISPKFYRFWGAVNLLKYYKVIKNQCFGPLGRRSKTSSKMEPKREPKVSKNDPKEVMGRSRINCDTSQVDFERCQNLTVFWRSPFNQKRTNTCQVIGHTDPHFGHRRPRSPFIVGPAGCAQVSWTINSLNKGSVLLYIYIYIY